MIDINNAEILEQVSKIKTKMEKYPPYVIGKGLEASASYLNTSEFKNSMYPPSQSGQPFIWSSERQRRKVFALGLPSVRTFELANSGTFKVDKSYSSLYVYYENTASYAKWVIGNFTQIIGHITRGWKPVNVSVTDRRAEVVSEFDKGTKGAWESEQFMFGGGAGL